MKSLSTTLPIENLLAVPDGIKSCKYFEYENGIYRVLRRSTPPLDTVEEFDGSAWVDGKVSSFEVETKGRELSRPRSELPMALAAESGA